MTDKKSNDSRRKLLKSLAATSGAVVAGKSLPESWSKPVIDSVLLPAHASTSGEIQFYADITQVAPLPFARAQLCVTVTGNFYVGKLAMEFKKGGTDIFTNPSTPLGTASIMTGTCREGGYFMASNLTANSIDYRFGPNGRTYTLSLGACNLPVVDCIPVKSDPATLESDAENTAW